MTLQLTGVPGSRFVYRGSLAPWPVASTVLSRLSDVGAVLVEAFGLIGLFGVDLVLRGEAPWVVEVNPRYTASVEALELAYRVPLLAAHREACEGRDVGGFYSHGPVAGFVAKEVLFATTHSIFPDDATAFAGNGPIGYQVPEVADLPWPGTRFQPGDPVLTVLAREATPALALRAVETARDRWSARLRPVR